MDSYYEKKKRNGYIFTLHDLNPSQPYISMEKSLKRPVTDPEGPSWWSKLSGRYRTYEEQKRFIRSGCVDKKLPPRKEEEYQEKRGEKYE